MLRGERKNQKNRQRTRKHPSMARRMPNTPQVATHLSSTPKRISMWVRLERIPRRFQEGILRRWDRLLTSSHEGAHGPLVLFSLQLRPLQRNNRMK